MIVVLLAGNSFPVWDGTGVSGSLYKSGTRIENYTGP